MSGMGRLGLVVMLVAGVASEARAEVTVPAVPSFEMHVPSANALGVLQLRALGRRSYEGKAVTVRGYVTYVYDCVEENLEPYKTRAQIAKELAANPTRCEAATLSLGDTKKTPREFSLRVADLPAGTWKVGEYLEVAGTFAFASPRGDKDRDGLVVYASAKRVKPEAGTKAQLPAPHAVPPLVAPKPLRTAPPPGQKMKAIASVIQDARRHVEWLQWKEAQTEYKRVVATWDGNDAIWAELGNAYDQPGMFAEAAEAYGRAFALAPANPGYAYLYGRALYLRELSSARNAEAKLSLDKAQQMIEYAITLAPDNWRAHETLAHIHAANEDFKAEAEELSKTIAKAPKDYDPYWRLALLYRSWGYEDEALAALQAWMKLPGIDASADRPYAVAAKAYEAKGDLKKAIEMLSIILAHPARAAHRAALERARLYIATKQWDKARADLAPFPLHDRSKMREVNVLLSKIPAVKKKR